MPVETIVSQSPGNGQPPAGEGQFPHAVFHNQTWIPIFETHPFKPSEAERFLAAFDELLRQVAQALVGFRLALVKAETREEFERFYNTLIVPGGLHVWLRPVEAGELWTALRAVREVER